MQLINKESITSSRKRLQQLKQQQKQISNAFRISNFYQQQKLDLERLKNQIKQVRNRQQTNKNRRFQSISSHNQTKYQRIPEQHLITKQEHDSRNNYRRIPTSQYNRQSVFHLSRDIRSRSGYEIQQNVSNNSRFQEKNRIKLQPLIDAKIVVQKSEELNKFEREVQQIWGLYELLTRISQKIEQFPFPQQMSVIKYVDDVCSNKFEFIVEFLQTVNSRYHKTVVMSRLLENMGIIYLCMNINRGKKIKSTHLLNFMGFCTSNLIFFIRFFSLRHDLKLKVSRSVQNILDTIEAFELQSYKGLIINERELILRMEHNNQTITIIEIKLSQSSTKQFQKCVHQFLKHVERDRQPLFQYAHYIFEFLSYYLNKQKSIGIFSYIEIAPAPYLRLTFPQSVIIEPWEVLFFQKNTKLYIRANTQDFIRELSKLGNVILWTDLMPNEADPLFNLLPKAHNIYYLYRYHCKKEQTNFVKIVQRAGCSNENTIIIDRNRYNFIYNQGLGIEMPWKGQNKDNRLQILFNLIAPIFNNVIFNRMKGKTLVNELAGIRKQLEKNKKKHKIWQRHEYIQDEQ